MSAGILIENQLSIPPDIDSLADFRRWTASEEFPEHGRIDWVRGKLEIEMSPDNLFWHSTPKSEIGGTLHSVIKAGDLGELFIDKSRVVIPAADLSCEPDIVFVSHQSISDGKVEFVPTARHAADSYLEIEGPPDLVVEIVSDSSVTKDTQRLFKSYFEGGVSEYWLVDARGAELSFVILTRGDANFIPATTDDDGFQHSSVFNQCYRFHRERGRNDRWRYDLQTRGSKP